MTSELYWLTLTILMTGLFWVPYILNQIGERGLMKAMANPNPDDPPLAPWAQRAKRAHYNAVENLVLFGALVLVAHAAGVSNAVTVGAVKVYFFARLAHYLVYSAGIPVARTLIFAVGWAATIAIALVLLGIL